MEGINVENFAIRFLISNLFVSIIIGILLSAKLIFKKNLSNRMQYNLWFVFLTILVVPFLPIRLVGFLQILSWIENLGSPTTFDNKIITQPTILLNAPDTTNWVNDFTLSVSRKAPSIVWLFLLGIWAVGIFVTFILINESILFERPGDWLLKLNVQIRNSHNSNILFIFLLFVL